MSTPAAIAAAGQTLPGARRAFRRWVDERRPDLVRLCASGGDLADVLARQSRLQRLLYDAGWSRLGWSPELGGLGGSLLLRGMVAEELTDAGLPLPFSFGTLEVLGPAVAAFATKELAAELVPRLVRGDESWCQGFSEPDAGSDLASLRLRAVDGGDVWRVTGEKVWTSWAQFADRCLLLARTGSVESGHRGITALLVDMSAPGIEVRPLRTMNGADEFCSMHFDDVAVPKSRTLGEPGSGWRVAMYVLGCERGAVAWQRQAWLRWRLARLLEQAPDVPSVRAGEALELVYALRLLSRRTLGTLAAGRPLGPSVSLDKLLMSTAERCVFDTAFDALPDQLLHGDAPADVEWRDDYLYSRAASIYGGAAEIQRNIVAEQLLGLPRT